MIVNHLRSLILSCKSYFIQIFIWWNILLIAFLHKSECTKWKQLGNELPKCCKMERGEGNLYHFLACRALPSFPNKN